MIRPSALPIAQSCGLAPVLAEKHRESGIAAEDGAEIHAEIAAWLRHRTNFQSPVVRALFRAWMPPPRDVLLWPEKLLTLSDVETGEVITEGTADLVLHDVDAEFVEVIDWKTGRAEFVEPAATNLQIAAYGLAAAFELGARSFQASLCFLAEEGPTWDRGPVVTEAEYGPLLANLRKIASRPPEPVVGPHCDRCWQARHCPAFMLPAHEGPSALAPFTAPGGLTVDNAPRALAVVSALREAVEVAEVQLKSLARETGGILVDGKVWGPQPRNGRRSVSVEDVIAAGREDLVRAGKPYEVFGWRKAG